MRPEEIVSKGFDIRVTSNDPILGTWHAVIWSLDTYQGARISYDGYGKTCEVAVENAYKLARVRVR